MGIKLKNEDFMRVLQQSETICKVHIRSKEQYMEAAKRSKRKVSDKMLEVAYSNFYNRNAILHTSAVLFMVLQNIHYSPLGITNNILIALPIYFGLLPITVKNNRRE